MSEGYKNFLIDAHLSIFLVLPPGHEDVEEAEIEQEHFSLLIANHKVIQDILIQLIFLSYSQSVEESLQCLD